ncbi:hypothetical protein HPB48_005883 [Haemaphysalis longicornis]|uniref:Uncharacterized protein n=1 Tax=Haemaphysalis longicornis TaxID=44386 RepID=A0A9J6GPU9_HAELO|nr:hypothetical protein HPB48_005883 [Haemaphysalis longicornis]
MPFPFPKLNSATAYPPRIPSTVFPTTLTAFVALLKSVASLLSLREPDTSDRVQNPNPATLTLKAYLSDKRLLPSPPFQTDPTTTGNLPTSTDKHAAPTSSTSPQNTPIPNCTRCKVPQEKYRRPVGLPKHPAY